MYRTLLATCGSAEMTHIYSVFDAANRYTSYLAIINTKISRSHTLQATCGTLPCNEYTPLLTRNVFHLSVQTWNV